MAHALVCPSCGEREDLEGTPQDGDIRVVCGVCGAAWMRGGPLCATCGGDDIVARPQSMTRHSRGTQLSIIGWRQLPLCRNCDAEVLRSSVEENVPVPHTYVAAALHTPRTGGAPHRARQAAVRQTPPPKKPGPVAAGAEQPATGQRFLETTGPGEGAAPPPATRTAPPDAQRQAPRATSNRGVRRRPPARPPAGPAAGTVPTVRQAIAAFLAEASGEVDNTAMLLLGTHLGSYNRLGALDQPDAATALADWFNGRWQEPHSATAQRARETLCRAVDFWGARGWLASDPAAHLR
ncbi:hypothetical protein E4198_12555 [Streptomyces sp. RKND-216]|uniref:hypothetical protein n=1 Tax=Streptomyces sp. RKND-216 TaxID=2562581 RepID=UPI00109DF37A|nr:hypothetical protein [Streptomyces sp. RKND-216]THA25438.1 hypothetical protein E4198_12555 [Streptomyces sp. RKND-216]